MEYNYEESLYDDITDVIKEAYPDYKDRIGEDLESFREELYDDFFVNDRVTGNGSGSYTFDSLKAGEYLAGNWDLLADAIEEFGSDGAELLRQGPEACDVTVRCYLLGQVLDKVLDDLATE